MRYSNKDIIIEGIRRLFFLIPDVPEIAQIEITNRCNFDCKMCQRFDLNVPIKDMDFNLYKKIILKLDPIKEIILTGWGEPLIHPKIFEMIDFAKKHGKSVSFTSNGSLLTKQTSEKLINSGLDSISFSVDELNDHDKNSLVHPVRSQIKNIENFTKLAKENGSPSIIIQTTLHKGQEKNIVEVIKWAGSIGAKLVNLNRLDIRFNKSLKRPSYLEERKILNKLENVGKKYGVLVEFRAHAAFSNPVRFVYKLIAPYMALGANHCLRVYNYIYINQKGEVTPCCALPLWSVGNLIEEDLADIWKSEKFNNFRKTRYQRKICKGCDVLEIKHQVDYS